jgi:UDP-glucuronate 4-epimerase
MKILITGGAGFIGSHLCQRLVKENRVTCIDNFNDFYDPAIKKANISLLQDNKSFQLIEADICNKDHLSKIFHNNRFDLVIHLAAMAGVQPSILNPLVYEKVNMQGTINLLEACRDNDIKRFIFASSSSVYGGNEKIPFSETDRVDHPVSPYAATKKAGELICHAYHSLYGISVFCFRFFTVYGPRQRPEMAIHKFTRRIFKGETIEIYGGGDSSRDYTYIDDIINGIENSLEVLDGYHIINLGNSNSVKIMDLVRIIEDASGKKADISLSDPRPGDVLRTYADIDKAKRMLGYHPGTDIFAGIGFFVDWYKTMIRKDRFNG